MILEVRQRHLNVSRTDRGRYNDAIYTLFYVFDTIPGRIRANPPRIGCGLALSRIHPRSCLQICKRRAKFVNNPYTRSKLCIEVFIYIQENSSLRFEDSKVVSFRLNREEYKEAERIASITSHAGKISNDSVAALAKACLFTRINEWKQIEALQKATEERDAALKTRNVPTQGFGYL
jgi:hypothetical protein